MPDSPPDSKSKRQLSRAAESKPRRSRWWKWTRRILIVGMLFCVVSTVVLFGARAYLRQTGNRDLTTEKARLDAEEPGWRWDDLQAARERSEERRVGKE